jgi:1-acyl-sn-glycerol-3-phosphate acyltransferase
MADPKVLRIQGAPAAKKGSSRASGADTLAAGAARAYGERAKRRRTPLITDAAGDEIAPRPLVRPVSVLDGETTDGKAADSRATDSKPADSKSTDGRATSVHRPRPVPRSNRSATAKDTRSSVATSSSRRVAAKSKIAARPKQAKQTAKPSAATSRLGVGAEDVVTLAIATLRRAAAASGLSGDDIERQVAATLAFVRRRLSGDYVVDDFGFDEDFTENAYLPLLRPLYKSWFRVEVRGVENIPSSGGALIVANHSGTIALDSLMTQVAVHDEHPEHRYLRMLGADLVFRTPIVSSVARKSGSTLAANPDAERLLASGKLVGVWPEGFKGVGKPFSERYKLQRFGRGGFVAAALRTGVPIVPCSIVGAEEIYPILGNLKTVARFVGAPYVPVTPTFPLLGPLGLIPLPSKWIIEFGAPVDTAVLGPQSADDPMVVFDLTDRVRETIQQTLYSLLLQRRSVFF